MTEDQRDRALLFLINAAILLHEENLSLMTASSHSISDLDKLNDYTKRMQGIIDDLNGNNQQDEESAE